MWVETGKLCAVTRSAVVTAARSCISLEAVKSVLFSRLYLNSQDDTCLKISRRVKSIWNVGCFV